MGFNIDLASAPLSPFAATGGTPDPFYNNATTSYGTLVYDVLGLSSGAYNGTYKAPTNVYGVIGTSPVFGADMGAGEGCATPTVGIFITTAASGGTSANFQLRAHIDNGSTIPTNSDAGWYVFSETGPIAVAGLTQYAKNNLPFGMVPPGKAPPRWYSLSFTCAGNVTAGACSAAIQLGYDNGTLIGQTQAAYTVV